jgi:hypothetical protein
MDLQARQPAFRIFDLDVAHCRGERFASGFFNPGMAVVDSVLPVSSLNGSAVSLSPFYSQS